MKFIVHICFIAVQFYSASCLTAAEVKKFNTKFVTITDTGVYTFKSQSWPDHAMGTFPNKDNPNAAKNQSFSLTFPKAASKASDVTCLPMGPIGMALNGVGIFNPYTFEQTDAVQNEIFDDCQGHPDPDGFYHYHQNSDCVYKNTNNELVGVAMDGYPIYGNKDENGKVLTSPDLDDCHGREYNGQYQYHMTSDFPYVLACFKGTVPLTDRQKNGDCRVADGDSGSTAVVASVIMLSMGLFVTAL